MSLRRLACQGFAENPCKRFGKPCDTLGRVELLDPLEHFQDIVTGYRRLPHKQFVDDKPENKHIACGRCRLATGLFRGHVAGRAADMGTGGSRPLDRLVAAVQSETRWANPKSMILIVPLGVTIKFAGFKSP